MKEIKILSVGNSFSADTMEHLANIVMSMGIKKFKFANLYIGGCSINQHYNNAINDIAGYRYFVNTGDGWNVKESYKISDPVKKENWDFISIQHGTGDKSRYTSPESYENLLPLVKYIRNIANTDVKIAFNMAWVADSESTHHEITSYGGNQALMYEKLTKLTKELIFPMKEIDVVSPSGTAIQNARTCVEGKLTRDGFHLSYDLGRYIAGLMFLKSLCNFNIDSVKWSPEGVAEQEKKIAKMAVNAAFENPFYLTEICVDILKK